MIADALAAAADVLSRPFRAVLLRSLGITIAVLAGLGILAVTLFGTLVTLPWAWADTGLQIVAGLAIAIALVFLMAPTTSLVAGLFLDEIADKVERQAFPGEGPGQPMPLGRSLLLSVKFFGAVILANLIALLLLLVPGVNLIAFLMVNAYLLSREYFELAALRHRSYEDARRLRRAHGGRVFAGGLLIALWVSVPILNLTTPLFATGLMVRLHKRLSRL